MVEIPDVGGIRRRLVRQRLTDGLRAVPRVHDVGLRRERGPRRAAALAECRPRRHGNRTKVNACLCQGRTRLGVETRGGRDEPHETRAPEGAQQVIRAEMPTPVKGPWRLAGHREDREGPVHGRPPFFEGGVAYSALNRPAIEGVGGAVRCPPASGQESLPLATLCWRNRVDFFMVSRPEERPSDGAAPRLVALTLAGGRVPDGGAFAPHARTKQGKDR